MRLSTFNSWNTSQPSSLGIEMSMMIRSGCRSRSHLQTLLAVARLLDVIQGITQHKAQEFAIVVMIIGDENTGGHLQAGIPGGWHSGTYSPASSSVSNDSEKSFS